MTLDFEKCGGLLPAIVQETGTGVVLMLGFMNPEAFEATRRTGQVTFFSRSRQELWTKGATSGNRLRVVKLATDCDRDTILAEVELEGTAVCHEGYRSCFFRTIEVAQ
jgi:phosphoribosyl-AMP cyclohydrolase